MIEERDYQTKSIEALSEKFKAGYKRVLLYLPTGSGKTEIAKLIIKKILKSNKRLLFAVKGINLIHQTAKRFEDLGSVGIIQGATKTNYKFPLQVASLDTLHSRQSQLKEYLNNFDYVFVDECHKTTPESFQEVLKLFVKAKFIGMTATPFVINGKAHSFWQEYIQPVTAKELVSQGYLCKTTHFAPPSDIIEKDLELNSKGDYTEASLYQAVTNSKLYSNFKKEFEEFGLNKNSVIFCVSIKHTKDVFDKLQFMNLPNLYKMDSSQSSAVNKKIFNEIKEKVSKGEKFTLACVNMANEGIDIPELEVAFILRPTTSLVMFYQQIGRIMRPSKNKHVAKVVDFTSNSFKYSSPQFLNRLPELKINKQKKPTVSAQIKVCPHCHFINEPNLKVCANCEKEMKTVTTREIEFNETTRLKEIKYEDNHKMKEIRKVFKELRVGKDTYKASLTLYKKFGAEAFDLPEFSVKARDFLVRKSNISLSNFPTR